MVAGAIVWRSVVPTGRLEGECATAERPDTYTIEGAHTPMADITKIKDEIAQDEVGTPIPINQKNEEPYLAPDGSPCTIDVLGSDAKKVKAATDVADRRLLRMKRTKMEPADMRARRIAIASAAVTGWSGWTYGADNTPFPCTPDNVKALLQADHILRQVEAGIAEHSDFFSPASSS